MMVEFEYFNKSRAAEVKETAPWMASSAAMALSALKSIKTNDIPAAQYEMSAIVAAYYRGHPHDGNTNLLNSILNFAATDSTFSNAFYGPLK